MNFEIPPPSRQAHEQLHDRLRNITQAGGEVRAAAKALAGPMHPAALRVGRFVRRLLRKAVH